MENVSLLTLTRENKESFIETLSEALILKFGNTIPVNYGESVEWGLIKLIKDDVIDTYQLLFLNDKFWTGTGGIVRDYNGEKVYQAAFRGFSCAGMQNTGLGVKTPTFDYCLSHQIDRARVNQCSKIILSFNTHNKRLYNITKNYTLPKTFDMGIWQESDSPVIFNGVEQWLLTMNL